MKELLSQKEKEIIDELRCSTGYEIGIITKIFEDLTNQIALCKFSEKEKVVIPFLGELYLKYEGEDLKYGKSEAKVVGFFSPSDTLKKNIGYYEDYLKSKDIKDLEKSPALKSLYRRLANSL